LYANPDRAVPHVGTTGLRDGVVVDSNDTVEIERHHLGDIMYFLEVVLAVDDKGGECKGGKVTDRCLFWRT
jgi:hypothetical protein